MLSCEHWRRSREEEDEEEEIEDGRKSEEREKGEHEGLKQTGTSGSVSTSPSVPEGKNTS